ncbi:ABC-type transport auxiliary lipoprotein family protein [Sulfurimonas sp.]
MKNNIKILCSVFLSLLLFGGCTSPTPAMHEYRLAASLPVVKAKTTPWNTKTLKVEQAYGDRLFMSLKMYYVLGKYKQYAYGRSRWVESLNVKITRSMTEYLRRMQLFKSVQSADSKTKNDYRFEINIEDFMQYFDENEQHSYVKAVITCNLINEATHTIDATKTFQVKLKAKSDDALGGVMALDAALNKILKECGLWLQGVCLDK